MGFQMVNRMWMMLIRICRNNNNNNNNNATETWKTSVCLWCVHKRMDGWTNTRAHTQTHMFLVWDEGQFRWNECIMMENNPMLTTTKSSTMTMSTNKMGFPFDVHIKWAITLYPISIYICSGHGHGHWQMNYITCYVYAYGLTILIAVVMMANEKRLAWYRRRKLREMIAGMNVSELIETKQWAIPFYLWAN